MTKREQKEVGAPEAAVKQGKNYNFGFLKSKNMYSEIPIY